MKEALIKCLREQSAALRGARFLAYLSDMSRSLRAVRLAPHLAHLFNKRSLGKDVLGRSRVQQGFTLIELMVALAVAAILLTIGIPSFSALIENQRMTTTTNNLLAAINLTRIQALERGVRVDLAPLDGAKWENGWAVFVDADDDQMPDFKTDEIIYSSGAVDDDITIESKFTDNAKPYIAYNGTGRTRTNANRQQAQLGSFYFRQGDDDTVKKKLTLNFIGRPYVKSVE